MLKWVHYARKLEIGFLCPNMEIGPRTPKNGIFQKKPFFEKVSRFRFQRAPNLSQTLSLSQVMQKNRFWLIMPKYGVRSQAPKNGIFQKIFKFLKRSSNFASNEPSTTCRLKVMQENILSKKLNLGLNFSTPSGGVTSPSLIKGSMVSDIVIKHKSFLGQMSGNRKNYSRIASFDTCDMHHYYMS